MTNIKTDQRSREAGFTLVELAIVMVIIGLLIGGVLQGRALVHNAQLTRVSSDLTSYDAAFTTFIDMFGGPPGDLPSAIQRISNCTGPCIPTSGTQGNNLIDNTPGGTKPSGSEAFAAWHQMANSGLIASGFQVNNATAAFGQGLPKSTIGGGLMGFEIGGSPAGLAADFTSIIGTNPQLAGTYFVLKGGAGNAASTAASSATLTPGDAEIIDRKSDDGVADQGTIRAFGTTTACSTATTGSSSGVYQSANGGPGCGLYIKISGD